MCVCTLSDGICMAARSWRQIDFGGDRLPFFRVGRRSHGLGEPTAPATPRTRRSADNVAAEMPPPPTRSSGPTACRHRPARGPATPAAAFDERALRWLILDSVEFLQDAALQLQCSASRRAAGATSAKNLPLARGFHECGAVQCAESPRLRGAALELSSARVNSR